MDKNYIVKKSNYFIMNSSYDLSIDEQKIILTLASLVQINDVDFRKYRFSIKEFMDMLGIKNKGRYKTIPEMTKELMKKVFQITEPDGSITTVSWLSSSKYNEGTGYIELEFSPSLKPYLLQLNELFTKYKLTNVLGMRCKYSPRIYEILKANAFKSQKTIEIELIELKKILGIEHLYPVYADFKKRVIEPAKEDLALVSDIAFETEEIRVGRKVVAIVFSIKDNSPVVETDNFEFKPLEIINDDLEKERKINEKLEPLKKVIKDSLTTKELLLIYDAANGDLGLIEAVYLYAKGKKVDNLVGYMLAVLKNGFNVPIESVPKKKKDFDEREYDFEALERKLLGWD